MWIRWRPDVIINCIALPIDIDLYRSGFRRMRHQPLADDQPLSNESTA